MALSSVYQRKRALVIGIDKYPGSPLKYCVQDAQDLSTTLEGIGFQVTSAFDCNQKAFFKIIDTFVNKIIRTDLVLFYFAGHGKQNEEQNYLLPVDYDYDHRKTERDYIAEHAINIQYIMKKINDKGCRITIFLLDCCRNYMCTRAIDMQQGLSTMNAPAETLIMFSCAPGRAVLDETHNDRNGSFIENLLKHITTPNHDVEDIFKTVARHVRDQTGGFQLPYRTSSLTENVCLVTTSSEG